MSNVATYGIYIISGILILVSGLVAFAPIQSLKGRIGGTISLGLAIVAIIKVAWLPIVAGVLIIMFVERAFIPRRKDPVLEPWSPEMTREEKKERDRSQLEQNQRIDRLVEEFFDHDRPPPTPEIMLQPCEWLPGLKAPLVVGLELLKEIVDREEIDREEGSVFGGSEHQRVAQKVLYRWFNMSVLEPEDGSYLVLPDQLAIKFAPRIATLLSNRSTRYACKECCLWHEEVLDNSERGDSSLVHSEGVTRLICPKGHVVYEQPYHLRIHRDLADLPE